MSESNETLAQTDGRLDTIAWYISFGTLVVFLSLGVVVTGMLVIEHLTTLLVGGAVAALVALALLTIGAVSDAAVRRVLAWVRHRRNN